MLFPNIEKVVEAQLCPCASMICRWSAWMEQGYGGEAQNGRHIGLVGCRHGRWAREWVKIEGGTLLLVRAAS